MDVFNQAQTGLKHQAKRLDVFPPSIDARSRSHGRMALSLHFEDPSFQGLSSLTSDLNQVQAVHGSPQQVWHLTTLLSGVSATWQPNPCPFCFLALVSGDKAGNPSVLREQKSYISGGVTSRFISRPYLWPTFFDGVPILWKCQMPNLLCAALSSFTNHSKEGLTSIANDFRLPCPPRFFLVYRFYSISDPGPWFHGLFLTFKTMDIQGRSSRIMR